MARTASAILHRPRTASRPAPDADDRELERPAPRIQRPPAALEWADTTLPGLGKIRATGWLPAVLLAACAVALMYLIQTSGVATVGYDVQALQDESKQWELRNEQLRLELAKVKSLAWVESEAVGRLGMVKPDEVTNVKVETR